MIKKKIFVFALLLVFTLFFSFIVSAGNWSVEEAKCGDGVISTEVSEVCDPGLPENDSVGNPWPKFFEKNCIKPGDAGQCQCPEHSSFADYGNGNYECRCDESNDYYNVPGEIGCKEYCELYPDDEECIDDDYCLLHPGDENCTDYCEYNDWNALGYCSRLECDVVYDGDPETNWVRGLGPFKAPEEYWSVWKDRFSSLSCEYFYQIDSKQTLDQYGPISSFKTMDYKNAELLNLEGLIKATKVLESKLSNLNGNELISLIFFIGYVQYMNDFAFLAGYTDTWEKINAQKIKYYDGLFMSRSVVEYDNFDTPGIINIDKSLIVNSSPYFLEKYCSLDFKSYTCIVNRVYTGSPTAYAGIWKASLIKKIYIPEKNAVFSLTHLSQTYMSSWPLFNKFLDFAKEMGYLNPQNALGDDLGIVARRYFFNHPEAKLSDFLSTLSTPADTLDSKDYCSLLRTTGVLCPQ